MCQPTPHLLLDPDHDHLALLSVVHHQGGAGQNDYSIIEGLTIAEAYLYLQEYERAVIFRLGRLLSGGAKGPGVFFIIPCIDIYQKIDMRTASYEIPPQEVCVTSNTEHSPLVLQILTKDSVTVFVNAIMYYRVKDPISAVSEVDDYTGSARLLSAKALRNVLGTKDLGDILAERESIARKTQ